MIIGIPKEIKLAESRIALVPEGAQSLIADGHSVFVQKGAGAGSGYSDDAYVSAGAIIVSEAAEVFDQSEMIVKVKEPQASEIQLLRPDHILFTYLHLASSQSLTDGLLNCRCTAFAYETIENKKGGLPLLYPMSQIAGRLSVQVGAHYLMNHMGGSGVLLGGVPGVPKGRVVILGGGTVGAEAAKMALGLGAHVTVLDIDQERMTYLSEILTGSFDTLYSDPATIQNVVTQADLVIGAVLVPGAKAPILVTRDDIGHMKPGSVIVDVAVDQGGCIGTSTVTTHENPIHYVDGVLHYGVANMPGAVPRTSTKALTALTLGYIKKLCNSEWREACKNPLLQKGLALSDGMLYSRAIGEQYGYAFNDFES
ncbi:MAG: alanine dehydrogenase [Fibrobacterales bacterium]